MTLRVRRASLPGVLPLVAGACLITLSACAKQDEAPPSGKVLAARVVPQLAAPPQAPRIMQVYRDARTKKEWIHDGKQWVPHDASVDAFYDAQKLAAAPQGASLAPGVFVPSGAHPKHAPISCTACHTNGGSPCFDPAGPAVAAGAPLPTFDTVAKTCASVACHGAYSGTFSYSRYDWGSDSFETVTVPYAGNGGGAAASWFSTGLTGCATCHGNPPMPTGVWHAPTHGGSLVAARKCETCHPDALSALVAGKYVGTSIVAAYATLHANGSVNVQARFTSKCFGCH